MSHSLVLDAGDQQWGEQNAYHLSVEEIDSVVRLRNKGGLIPAGQIVLHTLITNTESSGLDKQNIFITHVYFHLLVLIIT